MFSIYYFSSATKYIKKYLIKQVEDGTVTRTKQGTDFTLAPMLNKEMAKIKVYVREDEYNKVRYYRDFTIVDHDEVNYDEVEELSYSIHSNEYLLVRMSDFKVLNSKDADKIIYPASLTKLMTLDAVLHLVPDLNTTSSISYEQVQELIDEDASLAYIKEKGPCGNEWANQALFDYDGNSLRGLQVIKGFNK